MQYGFYSSLLYMAGLNNMMGVGEKRFVSHSVTHNAHITFGKKVGVVGRKR